MKKRILAAMLAGVLMIGSTGCGQQAEKTSDTVENTENQAVETASDDGKKEETAASQMAKVNTKGLNMLDDNYRNWCEVFVYSYYDSNGDGIGDLKGLTEKLDYLNDGDESTDDDLGITGIWLMPIMPSTTYHKYDVTDYCDIDKEYGNLEDFKVLVEECHNRGINVIIDLMINHSSSKHEWFLSATDYMKGLPEGAKPDKEECPYVDYYHFSKEGGNGYQPLEGTDWFYEGQFWSEMPDLNLGNQAVRDEFEKIVDFWLELGVDGFRMDAAKEYYTGSVDANVEVLSWFSDMVKGKKEDAYIVAEVWNDMETYAKYYESGIDSCFDFDFADSTGIIASALKNQDASSYGKALERVQETIAPYNENYIDAPFYTNHDLARGAGYYSGDYSENQTKMAQAMNLLMSGSAFLYYGEELGMKGSGKDENKRAPMYWSEDATAEGMCHGPLDMDSVKMKYGSYETQKADGNSIYQFVKETIKLRNTYPAIARGEVTFEEALSNDKICVIRKTYDDTQIVIVYNLSEKEQTVDVSSLHLMGKENENVEIGGVLLTGNMVAELEEGSLKVPAYSVVVLE